MAKKKNKKFTQQQIFSRAQQIMEDIEHLTIILPHIKEKNSKHICDGGCCVVSPNRCDLCKFSNCCQNISTLIKNIETYLRKEKLKKLLEKENGKDSIR